MTEELAVKINELLDKNQKLFQEIIALLGSENKSRSIFLASLLASNALKLEGLLNENFSDI
jgi:hypothetical protein